MCVPRFSLLLGRRNRGWKSEFVEVDKGGENRNFWLNRRGGKKKLLGVLAKQHVVN